MSLISASCQDFIVRKKTTDTVQLFCTLCLSESKTGLYWGQYELTNATLEKSAWISMLMHITGKLICHSWAFLTFRVSSDWAKSDNVCAKLSFTLQIEAQFCFLLFKRKQTHKSASGIYHVQVARCALWEKRGLCYPRPNMTVLDSSSGPNPSQLSSLELHKGSTTENGQRTAQQGSSEGRGRNRLN